MDKYPYEKPIEITMDGNPDNDSVTIDGEPVSRLRRIVVDSDMEETIVELEMLHIPSGGDIHISGYIIDEADFQMLKEAKQIRLERSLEERMDVQVAKGIEDARKMYGM